MSSEIYRHAAAAAAIAASWTWSSRVEIISWVQGVSAWYRVYLYHLELGIQGVPGVPRWLAGQGGVTAWAGSAHLATARPAAYQHHTRIT